MAEIVNLRRARKRKNRVEKQKTAEANRLHFGRSKLNREIAAGEKERGKRDFDGKRLDGSATEDIDP